MAGSLDGTAELSLMSGAGTKNTPRDYLATLGNTTSQSFVILVINCLNLIGAETTNLFSAEQFFLWGARSHMKFLSIFLLNSLRC
jgi:hypothetical protein